MLRCGVGRRQRESAEMLDAGHQRRQLVGVGVEPAQVYADVAVSGAKGYNSRDQWHLLDQQLVQGDVLVVAAIDRLGRRYLETMWAIYDLQRLGIRLRSLAGNEVQWTRYLDAALTLPRPSYTTFWPAWRRTWPARRGRTSAAVPVRDLTPHGEGRGAEPAAASHRRAARCHQAGHRGRDAGGGGGPEVRRAQIHAP